MTIIRVYASGQLIATHRLTDELGTWNQDPYSGVLVINDDDEIGFEYHGQSMTFAVEYSKDKGDEDAA